MGTWEKEYRRRVTKALAVVHYEHGFRAERVEVEGEDGGAWSEWTLESPSLYIVVRGVCPCGVEVYGSADQPEEIADLLRQITESEVGP